MTATEDISTIITAAHALTRIAALETRNEAPSAQWRTLGLLIERGPLRVGDLARLSRITQPGATRLIGTMTEQGLVARAADPDDTRAVLVVPTEAGRAAYVAWREQLAAALLPHFADLDEREWDALRAAARILTERTTTDTTKENAQ